LSELPVELCRLALRYAKNMLQGQEIRLALTLAMTGTEWRWHSLDAVIQPLLAAQAASQPQDVGDSFIS